MKPEDFLNVEEPEDEEEDYELEADLSDALDLLRDARLQFEKLIRSRHRQPLNWQMEKEIVELEKEIVDFLDQWDISGD